MFPVNLVKFLRTPSFTEHLRWLLLLWLYNLKTLRSNFISRYLKKDKPSPIFLSKKQNSINSFNYLFTDIPTYRSSPSEVFLVKAVLKICSKFTGGHPCRNAISIKLQSQRSPVNLLHIFRTPFSTNTPGGLLL